MSTPHLESAAAMLIGFRGARGAEMMEVTPREVLLGESLLTPGLQTSIRAHSYIHSWPVKNFDNLKGSDVIIDVERPILADYNLPSSLSINQKVYRMDSRRLINNNTEEFVIRGCDQTQLNDAETLVSKSWKCTTPSDIVNYVLGSCAGATAREVDSSAPARDYIAENIHPFQVVSQQSNYALDGDDPSFVHFMTYDTKGGAGIHHFKSLKKMCAQSPIMSYTFNETDTSYVNPSSIMTYSFPCDFDLLSDILNGVNSSGRDINSLALFNPVLKTFSLMGDQTIGCGVGSGVMKAAISNQQSAKQQDSCPDYAKEYLLKRQARMGLLEKDKIALRIVVPFNPVLHAGKTIEVNLYNKETIFAFDRNYGTGKYLILHMFHRILEGGLATTVMDCVSSTVGQGVV